MEPCTPNGRWDGKIELLMCHVRQLWGVYRGVEGTLRFGWVALVTADDGCDGYGGCDVCDVCDGCDGCDGCGGCDVCDGCDGCDV